MLYESRKSRRLLLQTLNLLFLANKQANHGEMLNINPGKERDGGREEGGGRREVCSLLFFESCDVEVVQIDGEERVC